MKFFIEFILMLFFCFNIFQQYKYKISIIIPIYKGEKYLKDCLESVINQTLTNIQIICINDESPDNSINILNRYAKKDNRIIMKNIKHVSISETRNEGLKYVDGEYIGFLDDDDFIDLNQYEKMYEYAKKDNVDLLEFGYQKIQENQKFKDFLNINIKYKDNNIIDNLDGNIFKKLLNSNWNKIYKTEIIKKNEINFVPNLGGEDLNFNLKFYPYVKKFKHINSKSYFYRKKKRLIYNPKVYFFSKNKLFFESLVIYYIKKNINKNNPVLCLELMIIGYKNLFWIKKNYYKKEYLNNFFTSLQKLNIENETIINKISTELKIFYFDIKKKHKKFFYKKKNKKKKSDL